MGVSFPEVGYSGVSYGGVSIGQGVAPTSGASVAGNVVRAMADRVYLDSSASATPDAYNTTHQLAISAGTGSGQSGQVVDYVVDEVTNSILYSRDVSNAAWVNVGSPTKAQDQTGVFGEANTAWTVGDDNVSAFEGFYQDIAIANDSNIHFCGVPILKDSDETRFCELKFELRNGTSQRHAININTKTGALITRASVGTVDKGIIDAGAYWIVWVSVQNNTTGNTTARAEFYPAVGTVFGVADASATGTCVIDNFQLRLNASSIGELVPTTASAVTETVRVAHLANGLVTIPDATSDYSLTPVELG